MPQTNEKEIKIKLLKVQETGFYIDSILLESLSGKSLEGFNINFGLQIQPQTQQNILILHLTIEYQFEQNKILVLQTSNSFEIDVLNEIMEFNEKNIVDKKRILPTLLGVAIGTLRGLVVAKTSGTILAEHTIPIINPTELCDHLFKKQSDEV